MELRHRGNRSDNSQQMETFQVLENTSDSKDEAIRNQRYLPAIPTILVTLTVTIVLNVFVYYMDNRLPDTVEINSTNDVFVAKRAMATLIKLGNLGPRPVGSYENEKLAFNLFKSEIEDIIYEVGNVNDVEMYNQKVSGAFVLNKQNWKYVLSYKDLQNVVVKVDPKLGVNDAVLLNCHFDTVPAGPGVSDNGVNCAVMVELLRILAKSPDLRRPIIFLFNGGEEIILQASHGFITQHPWFENAKYIINLDSCGAGGREIVFQTTKSDSYLINLYARTVPHPYGQVMGEELFQSGIIPSDTDFRIFRDVGNMSGLDLAHFKNGYVYHTKHDDLNQIEPSVLQNTGDNLLALSKAMSAHNVTKNNQRTSKFVFFDAFGVYMFSYTELEGAFANFIIVLISFFSIFLSLRFTTVGMNRREYSMHLLSSILCPSCAFLSAIVSCASVAFILDSLACSMSWYSNKINLSVYCACASLAILTTTIFYPRNKSRTDTEWTVSLLNGHQFFWTLVLFVTTMAGLRSSYLFMIIVLFPSVVSCILGMLNTTSKWWITVYAASLLVPATFVFYLTQLFVSLSIPIAGRFGPAVNPDYAVGGLLALSAYATVGYVSPVIMLVKKPRVILAVLGGYVLLSVAAILFTPLGFPYTGDAAKLPKNERFDLIRTQRTFYGFNGNAVRRNDSGYLIVNWDRHSTRTVAKNLPETNETVRPMDCATELMCGSPLVDNLALRSSWMPLRRQRWTPLPSATKTDVVLRGLSGGGRRMEFNITGPERINVYISPYPGTGLSAWSFTDDKPMAATRWQGNDVYVIRHSRGDGAAASAWSFWLEQDSDHGFSDKTINVTVAFNWVIHKNLQLNDEFQSFVNSFPRWAHVNYAIASVDAYVY